MIPYLLAALGGYLIGESQKKETEKSESDAPQMAKGGETGAASMKLYYHKTSGGAEYLCSSKVKGTKDEGSFNSKYTVRIDGAKKHGGELYIKDETDRKEIKLYYHKTSGGAEYLMSTPVEETDEGSFDSEYIVRIDGAKNKGGELQVSKSKMPMIYADGGMMASGGDFARGGKLDNEDELTWHGLKLTTKGSKAFVSGKPNPDYFGDENKFTDGGGYGGWWKSPNNFSIKKFEDLVKSKIPTDGVKFDSESSMFYAEGTRERMRKFFIDLMDSATMQYPSEFPFQTDKEYFNWESKRHRKAKNDIKEGRDKQAIDDFYFQMFSNYGEKSVKNELKKLFKKIDMAEMGDIDSKYHISEKKAVRMVADVFKNVDEFNSEVHDTEPENNIIFFAEEKLKKKGYPRRYYDNLKQRVQEANY